MTYGESIDIQEFVTEWVAQGEALPEAVLKAEGFVDLEWSGLGSECEVLVSLTFPAVVTAAWGNVAVVDDPDQGWGAGTVQSEVAAQVSRILGIDF